MLIRFMETSNSFVDIAKRVTTPIVVRISFDHLNTFATQVIEVISRRHFKLSSATLSIIVVAALYACVYNDDLARSFREVLVSFPVPTLVVDIVAMFPVLHMDVMYDAPVAYEIVSDMVPTVQDLTSHMIDLRTALRDARVVDVGYFNFTARTGTILNLPFSTLEDGRVGWLSTVSLSDLPDLHIIATLALWPVVSNPDFTGLFAYRYPLHTILTDTIIKTLVSRMLNRVTMGAITSSKASSPAKDATSEKSDKRRKKTTPPQLDIVQDSAGMDKTKSV